MFNELSCGMPLSSSDLGPFIEVISPPNPAALLWLSVIPALLTGSAVLWENVGAMSFRQSVACTRAGAPVSSQQRDVIRVEVRLCA